MKHMFLILNYKAHEYTIQCIESIQKLNGEKGILVVDNDLSSDSYEKLKEKYKNTENVSIIETGKNIGFARGNNVGRNYIMENFPDCEFIHCLNSDIVVHDVNSLLKTEKIHAKKVFYLLGPNVLTNAKETSPIGIMKNVDDFKKINRRLKILVKIYYVIALAFQPIMGTKLEQVFNNRTSRKVQKKLKKDSSAVPILSGCYIVFSKEFLLNYDFLFSEITFLYNEETILTYLLLKDNHKDIYFTKDFSVIHDHAGSSGNNNRQKVKYVLENIEKCKSI